MSKNLINLLERNIRVALEDYARHTSKREVLDDISDDFIKRLAADTAEAKADLREMFRKSPAWDEELQSLVINAQKSYHTNYDRVHDLIWDVIKDKCESVEYEIFHMITTAMRMFDDPHSCVYDYELCDAIKAMDKLAPKAYVKGRKLSRVFMAFCKALGIADEAAGSKFQRLFAKISDELNADRTVNFTLYISINPAHFLTMSNPVDDERGEWLAGCSSLNSSIGYPYNNGCSGYARDNVSFIVFTVADPKNPETLNNRKTTRQVFAYKPGNGLLLQNMLYGSNSDHEMECESKVYRQIIQREISAIEGATNLWETRLMCGMNPEYVKKGEGFTGFTAWAYGAEVSIRDDHKENYNPLVFGARSLCVKCGKEIDDVNDSMYCAKCWKEK